MSGTYARPTMRLRQFDYTHPGPYFVTICLDVRYPRFGTVRDSHLELNDAGQMIQDVWWALPTRFPSVVLDEFIVMPDHLHGPLTLNDGVDSEATSHLSTVMQVLKSVTTTQDIVGIKQGLWPRLEKHLWQPNYQDHIIRDERDLETRRRYIEDNPTRWSEKHDQ
jgi:putative transposase